MVSHETNYNSSNYKIKRYSPTYKPQIIELLNGMWSEYEKSVRNELFQWRFEENPYEKPVMFIAVDKEKVVGFRSFISQIFIREGKKYLAFSPTDTIIHRQYRRKGIISALNDKCIMELNRIYKDQSIILINTSTSKPSMPVYLKQHWQKSNGLRRFYFKYSLLNYLKYFTVTNKNRKRSKSVILIQKKYTIEITSEIKSNELSEFNNQIRNPKRWTNIRDEKFFSWRYSFEPEKFLCTYCYFDKKLQGYIILKHTTEAKGSIDQFEAINDKVFRIMLRAVIKYSKIPQVRSYAFLPEEKKLLKKNGFIAEPVALLKKIGRLRFPVLVRPGKIQPEDKDFIVDGRDIRNIENWHLQIADRH